MSGTPWMCLSALFVGMLAALRSAQATSDPLPSWNEGPAKRALTEFVARVTTEGSADFIPAAERIAAFDNDGTLWSEKPYYFQYAFALDRIKVLAGAHPEWKDMPLFRAALEQDVSTLLAVSVRDRLHLIVDSHAGMTTDEFDRVVKDWLATAKHPRFQRPYSDLAYRPMLEVLTFLRAHGFKTYIVSGGEAQFLRSWAETVYGIPPEQVVGSAIRLKLELRDNQPVLVRQGEIEFIDEKADKPVGIQRAIGRRPIVAFGNSDADFEMLRWTTAGPGPRLALIVHHTDAGREWAYDRESPVGRLDKALDEAPKHGWVVVDMKRDWNVVFKFE